MAKLLLVCAGERDLRELAAIGAGSHHTIYRHDYGTDALEQLVAGRRSALLPLTHPRAEVEGIVGQYAGCGLDGVISTDDYPGSTLASIVAQRLGLPGVDPVADLTCQHKYLSRIAQAAVAPDAVPWFARIAPGVDDHPDVSYPAFVKPVKSFFSIGARRVDSAEELQRAVASNPVTAEFLQPLDWFLRAFTGRVVGPPLLAEGLLTGVQATLDGFVCRGRMVSLGVVDSIMFPGTISFERFEYPSALSQSVQQRMAGIASSVLTSTGCHRRHATLAGDAGRQQLSLRAGQHRRPRPRRNPAHVRCVPDINAVRAAPDRQRRLHGRREECPGLAGTGFRSGPVILITFGNRPTARCGTQ